MDDEVSFADTVFGFWEDVQNSPENSSNSSNDDDDDEEDFFTTKEKNKAFWEEQNQHLQVQFHIPQNINDIFCTF